MISVLLRIPASSHSANLYFNKPFLLHKTQTTTSIIPLPSYKHQLQRRKRRNGICRAELSTDVPIGVAIGATIFYSLAFPITSPPEDEEEEGGSGIDSADARFAVMGIISFLPYFNWLSWLFAWLDTGKQRYAVYAIVYLAPYLRPNLSISPEDSWLPIASIIFCIIHIQLEASIKNGDIQGLRFFNEVQNLFSSSSRKDHDISEEGTHSLDSHLDLPSAQERAWNKIKNPRIPKSPSQDHENPSDAEKNDEERKH